MSGPLGSSAPLVAIAVPLVAAALVVASRRRPNVREAWTIVAAVVLFAVVASMLPAVLRGEGPEVALLALGPGLELGLRVDQLSMVFALLASGLWILTSFYAIGYVRGNDEANQTRFFAAIAVCLAAVMGLAFAADLLTFFLFYEALTLATYPLVTHKGTPEAVQAGRRYLGYLLTGGAALLLAMAVLYQTTGELGFAPGGFVGDELSNTQVIAVCALFVLGVGSKAAVIPLHRWLPAAMVAPTPVSALLHAVAVVKAGVFGFARMVGYVLGPERLEAVGAPVVLAGLGAVTIVVASTIALRQDNLKRRLAYSTIAHLSFIVVGLSLLSSMAWTGGLYHLVNHAALKITLFFCAGMLYVHARLDRVSQLDGIGRRMPVTMGAFAVAAVGLVGLPPMGGFVSKFYLASGGFQADRAAFAAVVLISGLLTAGYLFPVVARAFFRPPPADPDRSQSTGLLAGEASPLMVVPLALTATAALLLGLGDLLGFFELAQLDAAAVIGSQP